MEQELERLEGTVEDIIYLNEDNGYTVFEVSGGGVVTVVCGVVGELHAGESVVCRGRYENHATYGRQFHAQECETDMPKDLEAVYAFLASRSLPYIGARTADKIIDKFGAAALEVIANDPAQLTLIPGISADKADRIQQEFKRMFGMRELIAYLAQFEISPRRAMEVFRTFGPGAMQAIQQNPVLASTRSAVRRALRSVIAGQPVDFELRRALSQENGKTDWVCVRLQPKLGAAPLPGAYLSAALEERHPSAMAFEYERTVAAFLPAAQAERETTAQLLPLLDRLGLICGVSGAFSNLYEANQAWFQATSALQNGFLQDGNGTVFYFQDYLLPQLLSGALSGRPSWVYYPNGLKKLKAHDEASQVSYLETLRVYLDNNLSVTRTAAALYLHRSTLLDRLAHITQMLGRDLKDPDFCLTLGILLRAELQQKRLARPKT